MDSAAAPFLVGGEIFNLITSAMYDTPLAVYREYIQNSSDAIQSVNGNGQMRIDIRIDPIARSVTIRDNGPGLSRRGAEQNLIPIARSRKLRGIDRGFRGIGRLAGLAFAESVVFRTRSTRNNAATELVWDGDALRRSAAEINMTPKQIIENCVRISEFDGSEWPDHFFEVELRNVARHAAGEILNRDAVRAYIAEVCPVPMGRSFPFARNISDLFTECKIPLFSLDIFLDGNSEPITRPFGPGLAISKDRQYSFSEFEWFRIPAVEGVKLGAVGWLAHSAYSGAIPKNLSIRGLRARQGNLQIGNESVFDHLYSEDRFNRWCVGEIHVVDNRILPNGRRDYFEPGPHIRNLENQLLTIARSVSQRCRAASVGRNTLRKFVVELEQTETIYELAASGYLKASDARVLVEGAIQRLVEAYGNSSTLRDFPPRERARLQEVEDKLKAFTPKRGRPAFGKVRASEIGIYQKVFRALANTSPTPQAAIRTIEQVLAST